MGGLYLRPYTIATNCILNIACRL